jgi:hypothetical protein
MVDENFPAVGIQEEKRVSSLWLDEHGLALKTVET